MSSLNIYGIVVDGIRDSWYSVFVDGIVDSHRFNFRSMVFLMLDPSDDDLKAIVWRLRLEFAFGMMLLKQMSFLFVYSVHNFTRHVYTQN